MDEHLAAAGVRHDEAEAPRRVEELDRAGQIHVRRRLSAGLRVRIPGVEGLAAVGRIVPRLRRFDGEDDLDRTAGELRLRDSKTGPRRVPLTPAVERVLAGIKRTGSNPWVIAGPEPGECLRRLDPLWNRLRRRAGLEDVRLHDCRHSYASRALALGEGLPTIARLLGHKTVMTTYKYAHLARDTEKASAAKVGDSIGGDLATARVGEAA